MTILTAATSQTKARKAKRGVVIAYYRCSTDEQKLSPEAQREAVQVYAAKKGLTIAAEFTEVGVSGSLGLELHDRPQLVAALEAVATHRAEGLLVLRLDRLARDAKVTGFVDYLLAKQNARVMTTDGADEGPFAGMIRAMQIALAEQERSLVSKRTASAMAQLKAQGKRTSRFAPYGYRHTEDGRLVEVESEQMVIAQIKQLAAAGKGATEVSRILAKQGVVNRNGRSFSPVTMNHVMHKLGVL